MPVTIVSLAEMDREDVMPEKALLQSMADTGINVHAVPFSPPLSLSSLPLSVFSIPGPFPLPLFLSLPLPCRGVCPSVGKAAKNH